MLSHYPHIERQINDVAEKRRQNVRKRSEATKTAKAAGVSAAAAALRAAAATKEEEGDQEDTTFTPDVFEIEEARTDPLLVRGFCERLGSWWRERVGSRLCRMYERIMAWNRFTIHPNNTLWRSLQYTIIALSFITFVTISYQVGQTGLLKQLWTNADRKTRGRHEADTRQTRDTRRTQDKYHMRQKHRQRVALTFVQLRHPNQSHVSLTVQFSV